MDNVSNTTRSRDSTAGNLHPKGEKGHVHKDGHFGIIYVNWHEQYGQCHGMAKPSATAPSNQAATGYVWLLSTENAASLS